MVRTDGPVALERTSFVSFDGGFASRNLRQRPDRYRHLETGFGGAKRIARGAGMSYAAASFGGDSIVQEMSAFDRLLEFDPERRRLRVEAGAAVGSLASWAAGRGLLLPVLPGYPSITVGGCIAADVHGKNPLRDGTFAEWVEALTLYHPRHGFIGVDRMHDRDLFEATCGGYGLTGLIVDATLRLVEQPGVAIAVRAEPTLSLQAAHDAIGALDRSADFAYSWHDGTLRGEAFGRGIVFVGAWTNESARSDSGHYDAMSASNRGRWPIGAWNRASAGIGNAYFRRSKLRRAAQVRSPFDASFPFARQTIYHRSFGRRGLSEVQMLVPEADWHSFIERLAALVEQIDPPLMMMSLKRFRGASRSLGVSGDGSLLALDLIRDRTTLAFLNELDDLMVQARAQPYLAKDSRLPSHVAAAALPHHESFRRRLREWDPERLYESELSRRLEL